MVEFCKKRKKSKKIFGHVAKKQYFCTRFQKITPKNIWEACSFDEGEMAEWSIAAVLKTVELRGSGGSNPSLSATQNEKRVRQGSFFVCRHMDINLLNGTMHRYKKEWLQRNFFICVAQDASGKTRHSRWASRARSVPLDSLSAKILFTQNNRLHTLVSYKKIRNNY